MKVLAQSTTIQQAPYAHVGYTAATCGAKRGPTDVLLLALLGVVVVAGKVTRHRSRRRERRRP